MLKNIKQTWREVCRQPLVNAVSVIGTAFTIFLVMTLSVFSRVDTADFAPESNRSRMLVSTGVCVNYDNGGSGSTYAKSAFLHELYDSLPDVEAVAIHSANPISTDVRVQGKSPMNVNQVLTNNDYWRVFDYEFLAGKPYDADAVTWSDRESVPVVIVESVARYLYGSTDVVGRKINLGRQAYTVCGVVRDVSPMARYAYGQIWLPFATEAAGTLPMTVDELMGQCRATLLTSGPDAFDAIRQEVARRYEGVNRRMASQGFQIDPLEQPVTVAQASTVRGTNNAPAEDNMWWLPYAVLLLVPSINLSSMTNSLLRRRRVEVGVRRAFGATRGEVARKIVMDNLIVTVAGAAVGLVASWIMVWLFVDSFVSPHFFERVYAPVSISLSVIFSWTTFGIAAGCALVLNLLSCGLPSWMASRRNPVEALSGHEK